MNSVVINIIVPIVLLLYALPTFLSWGAANPFMKVSAVFAGITGVCAVIGLIIRTKKQDENSDDENQDANSENQTLKNSNDVNINDDKE
jgi:hypothetical protein